MPEIVASVFQRIFAEDRAVGAGERIARAIVTIDRDGLESNPAADASDSPQKITSWVPGVRQPSHRYPVVLEPPGGRTIAAPITHLNRGVMRYAG